MRACLYGFSVDEHDNAIVARSDSESDQFADLVRRNDADFVAHHDAKRSALAIWIWTDEYTMA